jgi:hypothetical protein
MKGLSRHVWRRVGLAGLLLVWIACPIVSLAQESQPSLAEIARRERERRKSIHVPAKVYTDKDVKQKAVPPATGEPAKAAPAAPTPVAEAPKPDQPVKDQAWWKGRIDQAREDLRRSEMFAEALQTRVNSLTADFAARDDPFQRAKISDDRQKALAEMGRVKAEIEQHKKAIATIEEEARQAGVPPGWIR